MRIALPLALLLTLSAPAWAVTETIEQESIQSVANGLTLRAAKDLAHLEARRLVAEEAAKRMQAIQAVQAIRLDKNDLPFLADALTVRQVAGEERRQAGYWVRLTGELDTDNLKARLQDVQRRQELKTQWENNELFRQALSAQLKGDQDQAIRLYQQLIARLPDDANLNNNLGTLHYAQGQYTKAEMAFRRAVKLNDKHAEALSNLGNLLLDIQNDMNAAEVFFYRAVSADPNNSLAYTGLGNLAFRQQLIDEAETWLNKALSLDPENPYAHNSMGVVMAVKGRHQDAQMRFEKALQLDPNNAGAKANLQRLKQLK